MCHNSSPLLNRAIPPRMDGMSNDNATASLIALLERMAGGKEDPLVLAGDLVKALQPRSRGKDSDALRPWRALLALLRERPGYRRALAEMLFRLFAERQQLAFYTETGLLPNSGFFSELREILARKILPEPSHPDTIQGCLRLIFAGNRALAWLEAIPGAERQAFWSLLAQEPVGTVEGHRGIRTQLLDSVVVLAHRIAALGLEPEFLRTVPRLTRGESPFIALCDEVRRLANQLRESSGLAGVEADEGRHLQVLFEQCRDAVDRVHQAAASRGTSFNLTFLVVRLRQHLERLELLMGLLSESPGPGAPEAALANWSVLVEGAIESELRRDHLRRHMARLTGLVALRVTENAGRTGEHYIAQGWSEWHGMWRAAAGAGFLIALMALLKIFGIALHLPLLTQGLLNGAIYAGGFAIIHICHGTVATKQPAMTAATIAATVSQTRGRLREIDRLAELVVATIRSQMAAISGNVMVALPLAVAVTAAVQMHSDQAMIDPDKAAAMLQELTPFGGAPFFAAIAGVWLFMSGLVSGLVDNQAAYSRIGERVSCHPWLNRSLGRERSARLGAYLDRNAGGLAGNVFFGLMLGLTPAIGLATGLPIDIRHIAFSAANFGYALTSLDFQVAPLAIVRGLLGVAVIGAVNLGVSFSLALGVALRSRGIAFAQAATLLPELWRRLRSRPARFFVPAPESRDQDVV